MREQNVEFGANGDMGTGYLVRPDSDAPAPGIVVIQEWWGLNAHIKSIAQRYAEQGFVALAPDLYHGKVVSEPNDAQKAAMEMDYPRAIKEIRGAVAYLKALDYVIPKKIGVTGFCMGGGLTLHTASQDPDVGAAAAYYGGGAPEAAAFTQNKAAILNIVGDKDRVTPSIQKLEEGFKQYSFPHKLIVYPGAEHAFFNDTRKEVYDPNAAQDAWMQTLNWFRTHLK